MTIRCVDVETTGLDPATDAIVEIASVDVRPGGIIENHQQALVCPPCPIPPVASAVHHILDADVAGKPPLREVIGQFAGADAYVSHNASFERAFLHEHFGPSVTWICTYKCALRVWPDAKSHSNGALRYQLGFVNPLGIDRSQIVPHRAMGDAIVTAAIFVELLKHVRWSQLALWSAEPALHTTLSFGKHRGQRYDAVPEDYLSWIVAKSDLDEGTKWSASYWLGQRSAAA